jgi:ADP-ribose pyrophosphatase YjhB (NUDIX family)
MATPIACRLVSVLKHELDGYGGVIVDEKALPAAQDKFAEQLRASLAAWRSAGRRGVWLKATLARTDLISVATAAGFGLHHAQGDYAMLTLWLPSASDGPNMLPEFATHYIGVGGLVINSKDEILLVEEKYQPAWLRARLLKAGLAGPDGALPRLWKLPGGALSAGESIAEGVEREVEEETGVRVRYVSTVAFRETLQYRFGKSDIYVVNRCAPADEGEAGLAITPQAEEIAAACWMPVKQFLSEVVWSEMNNAVVTFATEEACPEFRRDLVPSTGDPSKPYPLFHGGPGMLELRQMLAARAAAGGGGAGAGAGAGAKAADSSAQQLGLTHLLLAFSAGAVLTHLYRGKL